MIYLCNLVLWQVLKKKYLSNWKEKITPNMITSFLSAIHVVSEYFKIIQNKRMSISLSMIMQNTTENGEADIVCVLNIAFKCK